MSNAKPFQGRLGFDANNNQIINVSAPTALSSAVNYGSMTTPAHVSTRSYPAGFIVEYNNSIYKAKTDLVAKAFSISDWDVIAVGSFMQYGDSVSRLVSDKLLENSISMLDYKIPADGSDIRPALLRAIAAIKAGITKSRVLLIPPVVGYWGVSSQVLFDVSDFTLLIYGNVKLTATTRQKTFLFAYDTTMAPAQMLNNVTVISNKSYVDGNGSAMTFSYAHGDGSDNDSTIRFNYVKNASVFDLHATQGPIDSFSMRQCQNFYIKRCEFSFSKEDNGFSATTDWSTWVDADWSTFGYGVVEDCHAHDNEDFGMTAFNCSGVRFNRTVSYNNRGGYSYEDSFGSPDLKTFYGGFYSASAFNCVEQGYYINAAGVTVDDFSSSRNIRGYVGDNSNDIFENGVVLSNATRSYIGGSHEKCGRSGLAIFNGTSQNIDLVVNGKFNDNDGPGISGRGVGNMFVKPGTEIQRNGKVLVNGVYNFGVRISNSGGPTYLQNNGLVKIFGAICGGNGFGAIDINYVDVVSIESVLGKDNCQSGSSVGIRVSNATDAKYGNNSFPSATGNQTFAYDFESTVQNGYEWGNTGTGTTGVVANNATARRQTIRGQYVGSATYDPPSIASGSQVSTTITVLGAEVGDFVNVTFSSDVGRAIVSGVVFTTNNVTVFIQNYTASPIDIASSTVRVLVTKRNGG